ncbi:MAG: potassium-transporting ATPase subunit B, partial [Nitrospiraceae bacterium]
MTTQEKRGRLFDPQIMRRALLESFRKLHPRHQIRNPVMFVVAVGSVLTTILLCQALLGKGEAPVWFILAVSLWLWFTVLFANFAEAMAEGRGKAQAESLRSARREMNAKKLDQPESGDQYLSGPSSVVPASALKRGDVVLVEAGDFIPCDGEVVQGIAS